MHSLSRRGLRAACRGLAWCALIAAAAALAPATFAQTMGSEPAADGGAAGVVASAHAARYGRFAVAADHPLASEAGAEVLKRGGNAVDAAVATSLALSVVRPFSCGIGGGGFMVIWIPGADGAAGKAVAINYRETAPAGVTAETFVESEDPAASIRGGLACGVPGTVAGLLHALERYGTRPREEVMAPAIRLAREGFAADEAYVAAARGMIRRFEENPAWRERFAFTWERMLGGGKVEVGDIIRLEEQARVLEEVSQIGREGFYGGRVGAAVVEAVREAGGVMTLEDLAGFTVAECEPLRFEFAEREFLVMPPPSSGGVAMAQTLGLLERTGAAALAAGPGARPALYTHLLVESFKHAFADRAAWGGDPAFVDVPVARLMSGAHLDLRAARINRGRTFSAESYVLPGPEADADAPPDDGGTSHLCVVDGRGMAVACTETINLHFGSLVSSPALGFCLNNEMDDFTTRPGEPNAFGLRQGEGNRPTAGKRPVSSMSPTIVLGADGGVEAVAGASGGPRIITATTQVLLNALVRGQGAGEAVARARVHHQWKPEALEIERGFDEREGGLGVDMWMRKLHHRVVEARDGAAVQVIVRRGDVLEAACDPRKGGRPAGE